MKTPETMTKKDREIIEAHEKLMRDHQEKQKREADQIARGKRNIYTCDRCFGHIVTVDICTGVTPFMVQCRATEGCKGTMQSSMYRVFDQRMRADYEWYKPAEKEAHALTDGAREHVAKGGLIMRKASTS